MSIRITIYYWDSYASSVQYIYLQIPTMPKTHYLWTTKIDRHSSGLLLIAPPPTQYRGQILPLPRSNLPTTVALLHNAYRVTANIPGVTNRPINSSTKIPPAGIRLQIRASIGMTGRARWRAVVASAARASSLAAEGDGACGHESAGFDGELVEG